MKAISQVVYILTLISALQAHSQETEPKRLAITTQASELKPKALSQGFALEKLEFDSTGKAENEKERSGIDFSSMKPGLIWSGKLPPFFEKTIVIGGEDELPITDAITSGNYLFGLYGTDHYKTKVISVVDQDRKNPYELTIHGIEDLSFCTLVDDILYYTTVEANENEKKRARLHAFSLKEQKQLWQTEPGTAHGNFIVGNQHIITHFGFTAEDDFICVIDRGNGKLLKKEKLATAANCLIEEDDGSITVPAYSGLYRYKFTESKKAE